MCVCVCVCVRVWGNMNKFYANAMAEYKTDATGSEKDTRWDSHKYGNEESFLTE